MLSSSENKIDAIIVVQSIGALAILSEHVLKAIRKVKDAMRKNFVPESNLLEMPVIVCFTKKDEVSADAADIKRKTLEILGVSHHHCFEVSNYLQDFASANNKEKDEIYLNMIHTLMWRLIGEKYMQKSLKK